MSSLLYFNIVVGALIIILITYYFTSNYKIVKKDIVESNSQNFHDIKSEIKNVDTIESNKSTEDNQVQNKESSNLVYETVNYINQHKNDYGKDAIIKVLRDANTPEEIINKAINIAYN